MHIRNEKDKLREKHLEEVRSIRSMIRGKTAGKKNYSRRRVILREIQDRILMANALAEILLQEEETTFTDYEISLIDKVIWPIVEELDETMNRLSKKSRGEIWD